MKDFKLGNLRAFAIILVVLGHSLYFYVVARTGNTLVADSLVLKAMRRVILLLEMPIFFFISGYFTLKTINKNPKYTQFLMNKVKRILVPFVSVLFLYMIPTRMIANTSGYSGNYLMNVLNTINVFGLGYGHLWYLLSLFLMFALSYFIIKKDYIKREYQDAIIFFLLFICSLLSSKLSIDILFIERLLKYFVYFYLGYISFRYEILSKINKRKSIKIIALLMFLILLFVTLKVKSNSIEIICSIVGIYACYGIMSEKENKVMNVIDRNSFGLYLFHSPLIYIANAYLMITNPYLGTLFNFMVLGSIALLITISLRKTPIKFMIGE